MADRTIGELAEAPISALPSIADLYDDSLLVVEQQGEPRKMTGEQWKRYAQAGVAVYVESAKTAAETAQGAASQASGAAQEAESAKNAAQTAQAGAEKAQKAIENLEVDSITLPSGEPASVEKTAADGHVKLLFGLPAGKQGPQGQKGSSIEKIERTAGNGAAGTVDTYTITMTDGSTHDFHVYNGMDGMGSGDMLKEIYDPQNKATDIFQAIADAVKDVKIEVDGVPTKDSENPVSSGGVFSALEAKQNNITGTTEQVVGFDAGGKPTPISKDELKGPDGKTAYQYAVDGGYTGTEEQFQELMGTGPWLPLTGGKVTGPIISSVGFNGNSALEIVNTMSDRWSVNLISNSVSAKDGVNKPRLNFYNKNTGDDRTTILGMIDTPVVDTDAANKSYVDTLEIMPIQNQKWGLGTNVSLFSAVAWKTGSVVNVVARISGSYNGVSTFSFSGDHYDGPDPTSTYSDLFRPCFVCPVTYDSSSPPIYAYQTYANGEWQVTVLGMKNNASAVVLAQVPYNK